MNRSVMKLLWSCVVFLVILQGCECKAVPVYCKILKINCSKVTRHPCCTESIVKQNVEEEPSPPEPTTPVNQDNFQVNDNDEDSITAAQKEGEEGGDVTTAPQTDQEENIPQTFDDELPSFEDNPEEFLFAQPSQIVETLVEPEPNQISTSARSPTNHARKVCLVIKFNCQVRTTHPCCNFPAPAPVDQKPTTDSESGLPTSSPQTPLSTSTLPSPSTQKQTTQARKRPSFFRRPPPTKSAVFNAETTKKTPAKETSAETINFRSTRPSLLRRGPFTSTTTSTTQKPTSSSPLFRRPGRPASFTPRPSISSSNGLRTGLCSRLRVNCQRVVKHICCNQPEDKKNSDQHVEEENSSQKKEEVLENTNDDYEGTTTTPLPSTTPPVVPQKNPGSASEKKGPTKTPGGTSNEKLSEQGFESVVSQVSSMSSIETRVVQTVYPPADNTQEDKEKTADNVDSSINEIPVEEGFTGIIGSDQNPDKDVGTLVQVPNKDAETLVQNSNKDVETLLLIPNKELATLVGSVEIVSALPLTIQKVTASTSAPSTPRSTTTTQASTTTTKATTTTTFEFPIIEEIEEEFIPSTKESGAVYEDESRVYYRDEDTEIEEEFIPSIKESGAVYEDESRVYYRDEDTDYENYYYEEIEETPQSDAPQPFVQNSPAGVLDPNQIAPRVASECFRFDCLNRPDHQCCAKKNTKKRQTSIYEYGLLPVQKISSLHNNRDARVTATVTRVEKSINIGPDTFIYSNIII
jgi:hypothetical protein